MRIARPAATAAVVIVPLLLLVTASKAAAHEPSADASPASPAAATAGHDRAAARPFVPSDYPPPFGAAPTEAWLDAWPHSHFSRRGTPFVHLFTLEPAFLDRDLFFDYRHARGGGGRESELETELEWAFTRRLGLVIEAPLVEVNPDDGPTERGLGDAAVAPRVLLVDTDRFLLSGNLEVSFPSGSARRGLGRGEAALAPSLSAWADLGNWLTLSGQVGTEHGVETGDSELFYNAALTYSFLGPSLFRARHAHGTYHHFPPGLTSLIAEFSGRTGLAGEDGGDSTSELLFGVSYNVNEFWEVRAGYQFPVGEGEEFDRAYVFSLIYHF